MRPELEEHRVYTDGEKDTEYGEEYVDYTYEESGYDRLAKHEAVVESVGHVIVKECVKDLGRRYGEREEQCAKLALACHYQKRERRNNGRSKKLQHLGEVDVSVVEYEAEGLILEVIVKMLEQICKKICRAVY